MHNRVRQVFINARVIILTADYFDMPAENRV